MTAKKNKEKERRRARKLAAEAWEAAAEQNLDLAEKIIRRAVTTQPENPVLWNDQGMVLALRNKEIEAEQAFRAAISLAPTYAEPFAHLAAMQAKLGYYRDAVRLMEKAVRHDPQSATFAERLESYRLLVPIAPSAETSAPEVPFVKPVTAPPAPPVAALDWREIGQQLTQDGCALLPALLDAETCAGLRNLFDDDAQFAKTVVMNRDDFGQGVYRYFKAPIPAVVDGLRRAVYPHLAVIANAWQKWLHEAARFPADWEGFRQQCADAGQTTPTPILLAYGPGGFNALHRDLRGTVYFPLQLAVVLSPMAKSPDDEGFVGGEFLFGDVDAGKKGQQQLVPAGLGDALLFCTRDRLMRVGGAYGLQPVKHGVTEITAGRRVVLGVPFHEYR